MMSAGEIAFWRQLIGTTADQLVSDQSVALELLSHHSPFVRQACVDCLLHCHPQTEAVAQTLMSRLLWEPNSAVQLMMVSYLASLYRGGKHRQVLECLARVGLNEANSLDVRQGAYSAVLCVLGSNREYIASVLKPKLNCRFLRRFVGEGADP
jgi:hypothetical protein